MSMFTTSHKNVGANAPQNPEYETIAVTPSDSVDLPTGSGNQRHCRSLYAAGAGTITVNLDGSTGTNTAVLTLAAGARVAVGVTRVLATGTTATGILALY